MELIHAIFASIFVGFIVVDRIFIRKLQSKEAIYKRAKFPLLLVALLILISGFVLYSDQTTKAILGILTILLFFFCPVFSKFATKKWRFIYRIVVLLLAITTAVIGLI